MKMQLVLACIDSLGSYYRPDRHWYWVGFLPSMKQQSGYGPAVKQSAVHQKDKIETLEQAVPLNTSMTPVNTAV